MAQSRSLINQFYEEKYFENAQRAVITTNVNRITAR
jgi:hypothetical protein